MVYISISSKGVRFSYRGVPFHASCCDVVIVVDIRGEGRSMNPSGGQTVGLGCICILRYLALTAVVDIGNPMALYTTVSRAVAHPSEQYQTYFNIYLCNYHSTYSNFHLKGKQKETDKEPASLYTSYFPSTIPPIHPPDAPSDDRFHSTEAKDTARRIFILKLSSLGQCSDVNEAISEAEGKIFSRNEEVVVVACVYSC